MYSTITYISYMNKLSQKQMVLKVVNVAVELCNKQKDKKEHVNLKHIEQCNESFKYIDESSEAYKTILQHAKFSYSKLINKKPIYDSHSKLLIESFLNINHIFANRKLFSQKIEFVETLSSPKKEKQIIKLKPKNDRELIIDENITGQRLTKFKQKIEDNNLDDVNLD